MIKKNRVTFEELSNYLSHYEVSFLSYCKALEVLRSGESFMGNEKMKPKVAMVAFDQLSANVEDALKFKEELKLKIFVKSSMDEETDSYIIDSVDEISNAEDSDSNDEN